MPGKLRWSPTSITLDRDERRLIDTLAKRRGLSRTGMIRLLIRERAQAEGLI